VVSYSSNSTSAGPGCSWAMPWGAMTAGRDYPDPAAELLGQLAVVTTLITANLKQPGRLTFQLRGEGAVSLLVMDCDEQLRLRGMVRTVPELAAGSLPTLLGGGR